jgi:two-component system sensor histidine kinase KdpD
VTIDLPRDLPLLYVDPVLFEQVLINVLENAAKHTPRGTPIAIAARSDPEQVTIEISDRGPGISATPIERIFDKFQRGPGASAGGVGLGLAISRGIVEAHGGTILASNREGGGAAFAVRLPRGTEVPPEEPQ